MNALRNLAIFSITLCLMGCIQSTGDFGRQAPSTFHDTLLPAVGKVAARGRKEPVSSFQWTDEERQFRRASDRLIRPIHTSDWLPGSLAEFQRARMLPEIDNRLDHRSYQNTLMRETYHSSHTRYDRIIADIDADIAAIEPFYQIAREIDQIDTERMRRASVRGNLTPAELQSVFNRVEENRRLMHWVWRSLRFRQKAYQAALDHLEIETPSPRIGAVSSRLVEYSILIDNADLNWEHPATASSFQI